jgi:sulfur-carrier protein
MRIVILLWGPMRGTSGIPSVPLDLPDGARLDDALGRFYEAHPDLAIHRPTARAAVGLDYASPDTILHDGDEISLIPPVQGG